MKDIDIDSKYGTDENVVMSRFVWESYNASHERTIKRFIVALVVAVLLLAGTNLAWLWVWNQYDFSSESYVIENHDDGNANYLDSGLEGVINNGLKDKGEKENGN